ncbi:unnamed protein product [Coccothraustes coccothraustes]
MPPVVSELSGAGKKCAKVNTVPRRRSGTPAAARGDGGGAVRGRGPRQPPGGAGRAGGRGAARGPPGRGRRCRRAGSAGGGAGCARAP